MKPLVLLVALSALFSTATQAEGPDLDSVYIIDSESGGSGCPDGSVRSTISIDRDTLVVYFDEYITTSDEVSNRRNRKSCNVGVTLHVPSGHSVAIADTSYHGEVYIPYRGRALFSVDYFFAEQPLEVSRKMAWSNTNVGTVINESFTLNDEVALTSLIWSECGKASILRANTRVMVYRGYDDDTELSVGKVASKVSLLTKLKWKECDE